MTEGLPLATELAGIPSMNGLTAEEATFVYNVEVIGLPARAAAKQAGLPLTMISKPHLQQARELLRREVRGGLQVTKESVTFMLFDAIERARILGEPMTEIAGVDRLIKLHGLDAPQKVDISVHTTIEVLNQQVRNLSDADLAKALGGDTIIDGDFYRVDHG